MTATASAPSSSIAQPPLAKPCRFCRDKPARIGNHYCSNVCQARQIIKNLTASAKEHSTLSSEAKGRAKGLAEADKILDSLLLPPKPATSKQREVSPGTKRAQIAVYLGLSKEEVLYFRIEKSDTQWEGAGWYQKSEGRWRRLNDAVVELATSLLTASDAEIASAFEGKGLAGTEVGHA